MRYYIAGIGGTALGVVMAQTGDWRFLILYLLAGIGGFMFGMQVKS